ncbi:MAG: Uma2 family endonuclease [Blastocatellia bacterium]
MSQPVIETPPEVYGLITEDDEPVDNLPSEKQQRLLTEPLYSSWAGPGAGRTFLAAANVGVFYLLRAPAIVPDVFLSLDVEVPGDWWQKEHRSYFLWEFGKPPDVAIEIVSNTEGHEDGEKKKKYARMKVSYYVIYDPQRQVMPDALTVYRLNGFEYERQTEAQFPELRLGLTLWEGAYEGKHESWLRWADEHGEIILTGKERAEQERERAEQERERARQERERADRERQRADETERLLAQERERAARLAELLREMGKDPDQI